MLFAWILCPICTLLTSSHFKQLSHRCVKHWKAPSFTAGSCCKWFQSLCRAPGAAYHLCAQHTHGTPSPPLSQLIFSVSAVIFLLLGFARLMALFFSTCVCLRTCSAWWDAWWNGLWPQTGESLDGTGGSRPGVTRSGVFEESNQFCPFSLSRAKEVSWLSSARSSRSAACSCWTSLWCKQQLLCWSEGGRQLHVREVWPISIMLHCHFPQKYLPAVAPAACQKREQFFFLQTRVNVALKLHIHIFILDSFSQ